MTDEKNKCATQDHDHDEILTLVDEDGNEKNFMVLDILEVDGSEYAVLLSEDEDDEAIILKFSGKDDEGHELLVDIEDDDEWEKVADVWEEMVAQEE